MNRVFFLLVCAVLAGPVAAQTSTLSSGTLHVGGGAVLDLHGGTLSVDPDGTLSETDGRVTGGTLTATRTLDAPSGVNVGGLGAILTSTADLGVTTITRGHTAQNGEGNAGILRYYEITPTNNTGLDATLVFHYHDAELAGLAELELRLFHSTDSGATWVQRDGAVDTDGNTLTLGGIDHLARWTVGSDETSLPVELTAFEAVASGASVVLRWETASETNNAGFGVELRSDPTASWREIAFVDGGGTTATARPYRHHVAELTPGTYHFRLKQIDFDGAFTYSPEVEVAVALVEDYHLSPAYPNPFDAETQLLLSLQQAQHVTVAVYDLLGRQVAQLYDGRMEAGAAHALSFEATALPSGLYVIRVHGERFHASQTVTLMR